MFDNILCAVDGSECAFNAAKAASILAARCDAKLTFLAVIAKKADSPVATEKILAKAKAMAQEEGVADSVTAVKTGHPARCIIDFADKNQCDTVVMGTRGRGDIGGMLLGSVSHKVVSLSGGIVVTVK